jgi:NAD(P)-dependent dehydrogenase (short-subunit alcohol dehydrogenase family)
LLRKRGYAESDIEALCRKLAPIFAGCLAWDLGPIFEREEKMRLALVTGGARGIGRAIAFLLRDNGLQVAVVDQSEALEPIPGVSYYVADVASATEVVSLEEKLKARGGVDVLVNNAGIRGPTSAVTDYPLEAWESVLKVNLTAPFLSCRTFAPNMQSRGWGRIVNISSMAGRGPYPLRSAYAASKWGLIGFTLTLSRELGRFGITVNAVCPGPVDNENMKNVIKQSAAATGRSFEEITADYLNRLAIPQMPSEEDVAKMVAYLVSDAAWSITGQAVEVSSGYRA